MNYTYHTIMIGKIIMILIIIFSKNKRLLDSPLRPGLIYNITGQVGMSSSERSSHYSRPHVLTVPISYRDGMIPEDVPLFNTNIILTFVLRGLGFYLCPGPLKSQDRPCMQ